MSTKASILVSNPDSPVCSSTFNTKKGKSFTFCFIRSITTESIPQANEDMYTIPLIFYFLLSM